MPPKLLKTSTSWISCDSCHYIFSQKDATTHLSNCPPNIESFSHGFIDEKKILFNRCEEIKSDSVSLKNIPNNDKPYIAYLSKQAMQLCKLEIGGYALITYGKEKIIRQVWPIEEGSLTSIFFTRTGLDSLGTRRGEIVSISECNSRLEECSSVKIKPITLNFDIENKKLLSYIEQQQRNKVIKLNDIISFQYLGNNYKFQVTNITPCDQDLSKKMENLNIENEGDVIFYLISNTIFCYDTEKDDENVIKYSLNDIGGLNDIINEIKEIFAMSLCKDNLIPGMRPPKGILLYGAAGVGKSLLANTLGHTCDRPFFIIRGPELFSKLYGESESRLRDIFKNAVKRAPSVIFIDEVDVLCNRRSNSSQQVEQRIVACLLSELDQLQNYPVILLAATSRPDSIDDSLRRPGRLDMEIELPVPGPVARKEILHCILNKISHNLSDEQINEIANYTHGYVGADLQALCSQATYKAVKENKTVKELSLEDFNWARRKVKPSAMREVVLEIPPVKWTDIGGQDDLKLKLRQAIEWPLKHPEAFIRLGICPPRGVLMYGPPGCSKTMIARALATESGLNFLSIKGPELFSKWVGESEKAVRAVFRRARQVAPAIVFFDELDALCGERGSGGTGSNVQERVLAQLLTELDGVEPLGNVTIVAATNRPDRIDKALLRPGRLDRIVYVPLPDQVTREEIFKIQFRKTPIADDVDIKFLVSSTGGYSGAEVTVLCHEAALAALQENMSSSHVEKKHFIQALQTVTPRTSESLLELYKKYM